MPSAEQPKKASFSEILLAIKAELCAKMVLSPTVVKIIGRRPQDVPKFTAERDILIRPSRFDTWEILEEAAGRVDFEVKRKVLIVPRVRMVLDPVDVDELWLTSDRGLFAFEESIVNVLLEFSPVDANGDQLSTNGLKCVSGDAADRDMPGRDKDPLWGDSVLTFEVQYMPPLTGPFIGGGG